MISSYVLFSDDMLYRYRLRRDWNMKEDRLCFVLLNPSTADLSKNDPTVERCERRAKRMGFGGVEIVNLFALRSTDPQAIYSHIDPVVSTTTTPS